MEFVAKTIKQLHAKAGGFLVRRYIAFLGHLVAMIVIMKLTWAGGLTEGYFTAYCAFIAGHASMDKFIDSRKKVS